MANETLRELDADLDIIQKLGDEPNADNNLTAAELKAKFDEAGNIIKKYINENVVPDSKGKVPNTRKVNGKALSSDITLSASDVSARPNTWMPTAADVGAAPAGYGLGEKLPPAAPNNDLNNAKNIGWYRFYTSAANTPFTGYGVVEVIALDADDAVLQIAHELTISTSGYYLGRVCAKRWHAAGVWTPWEWVNPPMQLGVEYRTTERYMGKPVYAQVFNCGAMPNSTTKGLQFNVSNACDFVSAYGVYYDDDVSVSMPYYNTSGTIAGFCVAVYSTRILITLYATMDHSAQNARVLVKYTKTTD